MRTQNAYNSLIAKRGCHPCRRAGILDRVLQSFMQTNVRKELAARAANRWEAVCSRLSLLSVLETDQCSRRSRNFFWGIIGLMLLFCCGCQTYVSDNFPTNKPGDKPGILAVGDTVKVSFTSAPGTGTEFLVRLPWSERSPLASG